MQNDNQNKIETILKEAGISPTPVRILVYRTLMNSDTPLSLSEIETLLQTVDKSSVSRSLSIFRENHLVHAFNDGSSSLKYECCSSPDSFTEDQHVHFHCENCGKTDCFSFIKIPEVELPSGYVGKSLNYVVSGLCDKCAAAITNL